MAQRPLALLLALLFAGICTGALFLKNTREVSAKPAFDSQTQADKLLVIGTHDFMESGTKKEALSVNATMATLELQAMHQRDAQAAPSSEQPSEQTPSDFQGIGFELVRTRLMSNLPAATIQTGRDDVEQRIASWLVTQFAPDHGLRFGRALAALGAIPQPVDAVDLKAKFLSHQIGAWFDTRDETLHVTEPADDVSKKENALGLVYGNLFRVFGAAIFHETKALTTDARLARESLIAGDAALVRLLHSLKNPAKGGGGGVGEDPDDLSRVVPIPYFLRELELAPFGYGLRFAQSLHSLGGFDQLDAAYQRPPVSCIEIFDAKTYLSETPFVPTPITWNNIEIGGAQPLLEDTLGVLCLVLCLKQHVNERIATDAVSGWMNDRFLVYSANGKPRDHAVWQTRWRDAKSAEVFFTVMRQHLASRYKEARVTVGEGGALHVAATERSVALVHTHNGTGVLFVDAADEKFRDTAILKLGDGK